MNVFQKFNVSADIGVHCIHPSLPGLFVIAAHYGRYPARSKAPWNTPSTSITCDGRTRYAMRNVHKAKYGFLLQAHHDTYAQSPESDTEPEFFQRFPQQSSRLPLGYPQQCNHEIAQPAFGFFSPDYFCHARIRRCMSSLDTTRPYLESSSPRATILSNANSRIISSYVT